jgi:hypothetical protein
MECGFGLDYWKMPRACLQALLLFDGDTRWMEQNVPRLANSHVLRRKSINNPGAKIARILVL